MATESSFIWDENYIAGGDYSTTGQFLPVKFSADNTVVVCSAAADRSIGILQNKPKSGEAAVVRHLGRSKAIADGNGTEITVGLLLGPVVTTGHLVVKATPDYGVIAQAVTGTTAASAVISVNLLMPGMVFRTAGG